MLKIYACIATEHDFKLATLAVVIGLIASITAFTLADHIRATHSQRNGLWMGGLAFVSGGGIWAMHFIAMLAYRPQISFAFSRDLTATSIAVAMVIVGGGWALALSRHHIAPAVTGTIMALGIAAMHHLGMAALKQVGSPSYDGVMVFEVMAVAIGLSIAAQLSFRKASSHLPLIPAALFAGAICVTHFGLMASVTILPVYEGLAHGSVIDTAALSALISAIVLILLIIALATAVFQGRLIRNIREEQQRLKGFADGARMGLAIVEANIILDANDRFWMLAGFDPASPPIGHDITTVLPCYDASIAERRETGFRPMTTISAEGAIVDTEVRAEHLRYRGKARELVVLRAISADHKAAARLEHLMTHDALTGAATRVAFRETMEHILARESSAALLCLNVDRFQVINELYGHDRGDAVLVEVSKRIRDCLGDGEDLARLGSDEFAVIQRSGDQPGKAANLAARILESIFQPMLIDGIPVEVGASIGIALHATDASTAEELHKMAHLALRRAKSQGRRQFCFFDAAMDQQLVQRHQLEADLRSALAGGQFHLHYQPITSLVTGQTTAFEALLRWDHPTRGNISPAIFVPIAEEIGLIVQIGEWVLREACREAATWPNPLKISVNFSAVQLGHGGTERMVRSILEETGLDPLRLDIEVTEGLLIKDADGALEILQALKALGISISMDDFGTGYSSLSYFRLFPFDKVKIDQSFVRDMGDNPQAAKLVNAIIGLGKTLGLSIIAEGVETADQLNLLRDLGCDQVQGYFIAKPAPIDQFAHLIQRRGVAPALAERVARDAPAGSWHQAARNTLVARMA